jgi:hypothetical protein
MAAVENLEWQKMADLSKVVNMGHSLLWSNELKSSKRNNIELKLFNIHKVSVT